MSLTGRNEVRLLCLHLSAGSNRRTHASSSPHGPGLNRSDPPVLLVQKLHIYCTNYKIFHQVGQGFDIILVKYPFDKGWSLLEKQDCVRWLSEFLFNQSNVLYPWHSPAIDKLMGYVHILNDRITFDIIFKNFLLYLKI